MENKNLILRLYAITLTFILGYLVISGFKSGNGIRQKFDEITVERINIVEPNGDLKMVISNSTRQHSGMMNGKVLMERKRDPGIIFFNEEQDEVGGLIYSGNKKDGAGMVLSFDQYKNDQIMQMQYIKGASGKQRYGLHIWDRSKIITLPMLASTIDSLQAAGITDNQKIMSILEKMNNGKPVSAQRLFTGKTTKDEVGLFIKDEYGNNRMNIFIDKNNNPKFQILDREGNVIKELIEK